MKDFKTTIESHPYFNLPGFIEYLRNLRGATQDANINYTIILLCSTIIESVLYDLLSLTIRQSASSETIEGRLYKNLLSKLDTGTWSVFCKVTEVVFDKKLNDGIDNELWKSIRFLYQYRNQIVHGKPFILFIDQENGKKSVKYEGDINKVIDFLIEKKLIASESPAILNSQISDFFWSVTREFINTISLNLKNDYNEIVFLMLKDILKK